MRRDGADGWDEYAPFYDWENARTLGRRDVPFWRQLASCADGPVLELGCGTGRVSWPLARAGVRLVGVDRSAEMLARARLRGRSAEASRDADAARPAAGPLALVRGDIRSLPFRPGHFAMVLAPYGVLQSLLSDRALTETLDSVSEVLRSGGIFGIDLVPDVPRWREYRNRVQLRGRARGGAHLTLIESVRQDPARRQTTFEQRYLVRKGRQVSRHVFELTFRTLPVPEIIRRLGRAGLSVETVLGDYRGRPWDDRADVWIIVAKKV